jgi:hypothetical protein
MKYEHIKAKELLKDKKGVFGLTSVQQFFAIILGIALLAYVIIVIMGTLSISTILPVSSISKAVANESGGYLNLSGYTLAHNPTTDKGFSTPVITAVINASDGTLVPSTNYTVTAEGVIKATDWLWNTVNISYTYKINSATTNDANIILTQTGSGVSGFFGNISPVYAILAILVVILVLIVLVRVVTGGNAGGREQSLQL